MTTPADQAYHPQEGKRSTSALDRVRSGASNGHTLNLLLICHLSIYNMLQIFAVPTVAGNSVISLWAEIMSCFFDVKACEYSMEENVALCFKEITK